MAVTFIGVLLLMAGVEPNPGPPDKVFSFHYQYLLIEVGTSILRKVFDYQVGPGDFKQYLDNDTAAKQQLLFLINRNKITAEQQQLIPPVDSSPKSSNFDITLLCCLLRNACGLRVYSHKVWINPSPTDKSIEAQIYRLKECRNKLMHSGSVFDSETDLNAKWVELCSILTDLGNFCGMANLQLLIDKANTVDIDEKLKEQFDNMMSAWVEMDRLFDHGLGEVVSKVDQCVEGQERLEQKFETLVKEQQKTNTQLDNIEQARKRQNLSDDDEVKKEIRNRLMKMYKEECCTLTVSPLYDGDEDETELLSIYQPPSLYHVPYNRPQETEAKYSISSYKNIFCKYDQCFRKIYITGDAGVGKTSMCKRMSLLWSMSKSGDCVSDTSVQDDIDFMAKFDFVFYVSLRETRSKDIVTIIVELFSIEDVLKKNEMYTSIENILKENECLIIMDALDEWTPRESGKINVNKLLSDKCIFLTTCRPYKIENERLSPRDIDRQVQITGINSTRRYVTEIVKRINEANRETKNPRDFILDVWKCGLSAQLRIPIIASHLVVVWFDHKLTGMSRALIYSTIVDMILKRAEKTKHIELPSSAECNVQLPDVLSECFHLRKHILFLRKICCLSFNVLFKLDKSLSDLVFTTEQLESEPYCISVKEMDFLCKFGILSKNKVIGRFGKQQQKLSYLHKTYLEFFSALFVCLFDSNNAFAVVVKKWNSVTDVVQFGTFFRFFVGLSCEKSKIMFENIYLSISDDLSLCRKNAIFYHYSKSYQTKLKSLQTMVVNCFKEICQTDSPNMSCKLEDFIFDTDRYMYFDDDDLCSDDIYNTDILKQLLLLNTTCVKSVYSVKGKYYDAFDEIKNLHCLHVNRVLSEDVVKFTKCMLSNQSTLHTVCIEGDMLPRPLLPVLPVRDLHQLTSLSLSYVTIPHDSLCDLVNFLSDNVHFEHIKLDEVNCDKHEYRDSDFTLTLNLHNHTQLTVLHLSRVNILCKNVNNSSLKSVTLYPPTWAERVVGGYIDLFNCIKSSQLEHLYINGHFRRLDYETMRTLTAAVKTLQCMKSLTLWYMDLVGGLDLHPCATPVKIVLLYVTMSPQCFHCFIESCVNTKSVIKVVLWYCKIDGESHRKLSYQESLEESVKYMSEYLTTIPAVTITYKGYDRLHFETTSCQ